MSWSHVQGTGAQASSGGITSLSKAFVSSVTVGNLICVGCANFTGGTPTIGDTHNTYTLVGPFTSGSDNLGAAYAPVTTGGSITVTATVSSSYPAISIDEFDPGGTPAFDNDAHSSGTSTSISSGSVTVTGTDLLFGVVNPAGESPTIGSGFSAGYNNNGGIGGQSEGLMAEYQLNITSNTAITASIPTTTSDPWIDLGLSFTATGGGASAGPPYWLDASALRPRQRPALSGTQISSIYG